MTWSISLSGHDDLSGEEKAKLEEIIVGEAKALAHSLAAQEGNRVTMASASTNTTGSVNLLEDNV
jgi:hypothetical protein